MVLKMTLQFPNLKESNKIYKKDNTKVKDMNADSTTILSNDATPSAPGWCKSSHLLFDAYVCISIKLGEFFHGMLFFLDGF
jgi:hypothetical protein